MRAWIASMRARSGQTTEATTDAHLEVDLGLLEQFEVLAEAVVREPRGYRSVVCHFRSTAVDKGARGGAPFGEVLFGCRHNLRRGAQGSRGQSCNSQPEGCGYVRYSQLSGLCRGCGRTEPPAVSPERPCLPL
jgi:hypothetical protein